MAKKPTLALEVKCPHCQATLLARAWKVRTNPAEKPDYRIDTAVEIVKQGRLFPGEEAEAT